MNSVGKGVHFGSAVYGRRFLRGQIEAVQKSGGINRLEAAGTGVEGRGDRGSAVMVRGAASTIREHVRMTVFQQDLFEDFSWLRP
jgi:hypothetical protein